MRVQRERSSSKSILAERPRFHLDDAVLAASGDFEFRRWVSAHAEAFGEFCTRDGCVRFLPAPLAKAVLSRAPFDIARLRDRERVAEAEIITCVLDGLLALEAGSRALTGAEALERICEETSFAEPRSHLERLSAEALDLVSWFPDRPFAEMTNQLYRHNTIALSSQRMRRFRLQGGPEARVDRLALEDEWRFEPAPSWLYWKRNEGRFRGPIPYKLYVSVDHDALIERLPAIAGLAMRTRAKAFKIGRNLCDLLRPDKMVVYFASWEDLLSAKDEIRDAVTELPAHGAPFTAQLDSTGALSCGIDPPHGSTSFRHHLCCIAASAMKVWRRAPSRLLRANEFALIRLILQADPAPVVAARARARRR
jgi:hypothetical protein